MTFRDSDDTLNPNSDRRARVARDSAGSSCRPQTEEFGEEVPRHCNPLKLAATLHWHPDDGVAARNIESKRVLDYWLLQLEHFDPIFAPEYLEAPALLGELLIEEAEHVDRMVRVQEDERFHHWGLCQHLLAESERAVASSALLSRDLSELGVAVAMRLDPGQVTGFQAT